MRKERSRSRDGLGGWPRCEGGFYWIFPPNISFRAVFCLYLLSWSSPLGMHINLAVVV